MNNNSNGSGNVNDTDVDKINTEIYSMLELLDTNIIKSKTVLEHKYSYLYKTSPTLFNFILKNHNKIDRNSMIKNIELMLGLVFKIQKSEISQYDASSVIGKYIGEQYIPQLKKE